jgi:hypothetical protein
MMKKGSFPDQHVEGGHRRRAGADRRAPLGRLAAAGLDVYAREPRIPRALLRMEKTVLLPHIGSATLETRIAMASLAATNLIALLEGRHPPHRVARSPSSSRASVIRALSPQARSESAVERLQSH